MAIDQHGSSWYKRPEETLTIRPTNQEGSILDIRGLDSEIMAVQELVKQERLGVFLCLSFKQKGSIVSIQAHEAFTS